VTPELLKAGSTADIMVEGSGSALVVDFGDGATKSLAPMTNQAVAIEHVYASAGTYTLKVMSGTETIASQSVVVQS
jgi:PKD repeat protein